jgi:hypothetical protein
MRNIESKQRIATWASVIGSIMLVSLVFMADAYAGPGGGIASSIFKSRIGQIILVILIIIFLPLIIYAMIKDAQMRKRAYKDLGYLSTGASQFDWLSLKEKTMDCFTRIHQAWQSENVEPVSHLMTPWYWQNQQQVYLNEWAAKGLRNECEVKKIKSVEPLLVVHRNENGIAHDGTRVVVTVTAYMKDCLIEKATGKIVKGDNLFGDVTTYWTMLWEKGEWRVSLIESNSEASQYSQLLKTLPAIQETMLDRQQTKQQQPY